MKRTLLIILTAVILCALPSCGTEEVEAGDTMIIEPMDTEGFIGDVDAVFSSRDTDPSYRNAGSTHITLSGTEAVVTGLGATAEGGVVTVTAEGTYIITGELTSGHIVVNAPDIAKIQLVLNGASINSPDYAAIVINRADKVFITLAPGTENTLTDGSVYSGAAVGDTSDAAIFSRADLTVNGSGSLTVKANNKHGIVSKDDLIIAGATVAVDASSTGIDGKDCLKLLDANITVRSGSDGMKSSNDTDAGRGGVYLRNSVIKIEAGIDGIQAEKGLRVDGGSIFVSAGDEALKGGTGIYINAGTLGCTAGSGKAADYAGDSVQPVIIYKASLAGKAGDAITLKTGTDDTDAVEFTASGDYKVLIFSSPGLESGTTCAVGINGKSNDLEITSSVVTNEK